ncbi:MAG: serine/threonine protein kinase [Anaerolineae bacterium]|nr:serine/threonine protein kinase [Anaerolineae bacterium]MCO5205589.1 serine/threonine protein kinase [Anaerolineae bacterium]
MDKPEKLVGTQLGSYKITAYVASGGMADVYLAHDAGLQRDAAIKILLPYFARNAEFVERFRREGRAAAKLRHNNIVQIFGIDTTPEGRPYMAMEYVGKDTLDDVLDKLAKEGRLMSPDYALALTRQLADALRVAHDAGIVHRDVKPSNVLLREDGTPVLTDLGIAVVENDPRLTRTNTLMGTPEYMSPEQAQSATLDGRSDIYSLGVILYEMLAGERPFAADAPWSIVHKHLYEAPPPLRKQRPGLPNEVYAIVDRCLQKEPQKRYDSADELVGALDGALDIVGAGGQTSQSGVWLWRPIKTGQLFISRTLTRPKTGQITTSGRRRTPLIAGTIVVLVIVALLLWQPWQSDTPEPDAVTATAVAEENATTSNPTPTPLPPTSTIAAAIASATENATPTGTATPTRTPVPIKSPTAVLLPTATVQTDVAVRTGPGGDYPVVTSLLAGDEVQLIGRSADMLWVQILLQNDREAWLQASQLSDVTSQEIRDMQVVNDIPPTPTPTNTPVPPTNTPLPPTNTPVPPTNTPVPPTNTSVPPTNTPVPPTNTPVPPTNTPVPPTNTPLPPTPTPPPPPPTPPPLPTP